MAHNNNTSPLTPADLAPSLSDTQEAMSGGMMRGGGETEAKFDHPVYKKLAVLNGEVNRMSKEQIKDELIRYNLCTRGHKDVLKKRLKNFIKQRQLASLPLSERIALGHCPPLKQHISQYRHLVVIDFEATCERKAQGEPQNTYWHEIIEFPAVLIHVPTCTVIDEFHSYVRPLLNPVLSEFCTELTGITQETVDSAPCFIEVLQSMEEWLKGHGLDVEVKGKRKWAVLTDGPWDMCRFMYLQCRASDITFPRWALQWINIRKAYTAVYKPRGNSQDGKFRVNLTSMLEGLGIPLVGRLHSGLADTRNIASIAVQMIRDGFSFRINERLYADRNDPAIPADFSEGLGENQEEVIPEEQCAGEILECVSDSTASEFPLENNRNLQQNALRNSDETLKCEIELSDNLKLDCILEEMNMSTKDASNFVMDSKVGVLNRKSGGKQAGNLLKGIGAESHIDDEDVNDDEVVVFTSDEGNAVSNARGCSYNCENNNAGKGMDDIVKAMNKL